MRRALNILYCARRRCVTNAQEEAFVIYLDNAATSFPKAPQVAAAMSDALTQAGANPGRSGHRLSLAAGRIVWSCREQLADFLGVEDPSRIVFCQNCTDALNTAIHGFVQRGDHVVSTLLEHNSVLRPLSELARMGVITLTLVRPGVDGRVTPETALSAITPRTRLMVLTHASNVTGVVQDVRRIAGVCRRRNVTLLVDAAQSLGHVPVSPAALGADMLAFPGHKGLLGPHGTGGLYIREGLSVYPLRQGGTGSVSESMFQPDDMPDRFESGTLNLPGIAGLSAGIRFVRQHREEIESHHRALCARLTGGLRQIPGVRLYSPPGSLLAAFNVEGMASGEVADALNADNVAVRGGLHCAPGAHQLLGTLETGAVRASPGPFNTERDVDLLLTSVERIAARRA